MLNVRQIRIDGPHNSCGVVIVGAYRFECIPNLEYGFVQIFHFR